MKKGWKFLTIASLLLSSGYLLISPYIKEQNLQTLQPGIADKIMRFHIMANSDEVQDQNLKLQVRDAVGEYLKTYLEDAENKEESMKIIENHMDGILQTASGVITEKGYDYEVRGNVVKTYFPRKTYGQYAFPEGEYDALEITIGKGQGHNWWCVIYPQMCFANSVYEIDENAQERLKEVLSAKEYQAVFDSGNYEIRWKFLEYFK